MSGFVLSAFGDEIDTSLDRQMEVLATHDIHHIELRGADGKNVSELTPKEARKMKARMDAKGFAVSALGSPIGKIGITDDFEAHLTLFDRLLQTARIFGTRYIRVFSFYIPEGQDPERFADEVIRRLKIMTERAEQAGIILLHENEKGIYGSTPERCLKLLKAIGSPALRMTFDPANFVQCGVLPSPAAFEMLKEYVVYMHIKDARLSDGNVMPAGYGDGGVEDILIELQRSGFRGFLSIEPHLGYFPGLEKLEQNLDVGSISKGGAESFAVAENALKVILSRIESNGNK